MEIGFGTGGCLADAAARWPERDFLGLEVHMPGIGAALQKLDAASVDNARVMRGDAFEVLLHHLAPDTLDEIWLFFPDPFPRRQAKMRRLVQPAFVALLASRARPDAVLRLATDIEDYALEMLGALGGSECWENSHGNGEFAPRPEWRPVTLYEQRGLDEGRAIYDLCFVLRASPGA